MAKPAKLKRSLGLPMITFYGLGTIVGRGFYALVGKAAIEAGMLTTLAFFMASAIAMFSAFSYAGRSARYPYSAGEAHYLLVAFLKLWPSAIVGWCVIATGVVSAPRWPTHLPVFFCTLVEVPKLPVVYTLVLGLGLAAAWAIGQSAWLALPVTVVELGALAVVYFCRYKQITDHRGSLAQTAPRLVGRRLVRRFSGCLPGALFVRGIRRHGECRRRSETSGAQPATGDSGVVDVDFRLVLRRFVGRGPSVRHFA